MAEAIFNMVAQSAQLQGSRLCARSAGIDATWAGKVANSEAQKLMLEMGLDISQHRGKYIDQGLVDWADVILTMEQQQKYYVMGLFPHTADKVFLISEFAGEEGEVPDPYRQGPKAYRQCASQLTRFINIILENMKPPRFTGKTR
jgi:protein-tyrosine phosphatase